MQKVAELESVGLTDGQILSALRAFRRGDFSVMLPDDLTGSDGEIAEAFNDVVRQNRALTTELARLRKAFGRDGRTSERARAENVAGGWRDCIESVNELIGDTVEHTAEISRVVSAVAQGDLAQTMALEIDGRPLKGDFLRSARTINTMVDRLSVVSSEVTRVAREVGTEGKLGGQAKVKGVAGTWKDLTDNVNAMATNLTSQVRNIADVTTAVARGDLSKKITVDVKGEIQQLKETINTMVDQLNSFASEVTRVAREVGTEGKLGGQAKVEGVAGTWKDLTDNVNAMATNLTSQVRNIADVTTAVARGDLSKKITVDVKGEIQQLKETINTMVDQLNSFASEVTRVAREVGTEGKLGGEARVEGAGGTWKDLTENVNAMASNLTSQVRNIADVTTAVARGDLSKKITVDVKGEILELKNTINTMVDQLNGFASEVTRVAREVGTQGKLGGQAKVEGVAGTWKDLTDNVNMMAANLTNQVRGIAQVVTAVANGNMKRKLTVDAKGEIAELAETINGMIDTLATFGDQVTDVAREVGIEGKLGGQAKVPGAAGLWRDLTDNVNQLADNLTTQVRAIAEVATAVAAGDLTRSIAVEASGEVAVLKDNINQMISNLRETTEYNEQQDWLKTNLARFTRIMQGERDLVTVCNLVLSEIAPLIEVQHGALYVLGRDEEPLFELTASYAMNERKSLSNSIRIRQGLVGQCAFERQRILLTNVPADYVRISSGLGEAPPLNIVVLPVIFENEVLAVIELASFNRLTAVHLSFLDQLVESIGIVLNTISASMRTEDLLKQSQILTKELQSQQAELKSTNDRLEQQATSMRQSEDLLKTQQEELRGKNEELEEKATQLQAEKRQVEAINREVETGRAALEEKAEQLALTSKYKSEFLANMSHELRTPLNSLLILSKLLADNSRGNLSDKQIEHARTIYGAGSDLLRMINDILDLSKIESGTVTLDVGAMSFDQFRQHSERTFRELAEERKLEFSVEIDPELPAGMMTDSMRLQQIVNNLLSNAFKFTDEGSVRLRVAPGPISESHQNPRLAASEAVIAFAVSDTGIGITPSQQQIIFEAFQQADGTMSRRYGGTGLGLSISRELAALLGGEIRLVSTPGEGSTFTLLLPLDPVVEDTRAVMPDISLPSVKPAEKKGAAPTPGAAASRRTGRPVIAIVEDDPVFARILLDIADEQGFEGLVVSCGRELPSVLREHQPEAVSLDIQLPDIDGWALLDLLRQDRELRHLPIHVISVVEDEELLRRKHGIEYSGKPLSREQLVEVFERLHRSATRRDRRVLLARSGRTRSALEGHLKAVERVSLETASVREAPRRVAAGGFDCIVVIAKQMGSELGKLVEAARSASGTSEVPVIVALSERAPDEDAARLAEAGVRVFVTDEAGDGPLFDEVACALRLPISALPADMVSVIGGTPKRDALLEGRKIAIIDDDIRNIFSMTALLEEHQAVVVSAEDGRSGIQLLDRQPDAAAVLVDIMMPGMDGYETIRRIRSSEKLRDLPLIAVTAKAMPEDREKCFEAGASDYLSKPVDKDELVAVLRTWMKRRYGDMDARG